MIEDSRETQQRRHLSSSEGVNILGVRLDRIDMNHALLKIKHFVRARTPHQLVTLNLDFISKALKDQEFKDIINSADLVVADGVPLIWISKLAFGIEVTRVNGTDLVYACCGLATEEGFSTYFLGGEPWVNVRACRNLLRLYPKLRIAGCYSPPFGDFEDSENEKTINKIKSANPDILFVALGAPKQEKWIRQNMDFISVPISVGIGGSLDIIAGKYNRAPIWMQHYGFEWLFRLTQQPKYLWKRYLIDDVKVLLLCLRHLWQKKLSICKREFDP